MTTDERIGHALRDKRLLKRMTLEQVASMMKVSKNTVSYMELGKTRITVTGLINYCKAVGCSWIEILEEIDKEGDVQ